MRERAKIALAGGTVFVVLPLALLLLPSWDREPQGAAIAVAALAVVFALSFAWYVVRGD